MSAADLVLDPGVLESVPTAEWGGYSAAAHTAGTAIVPWRRAWLAARAAGVDAHPSADALAESRFDQCLVHLQKSRDATFADLGDAWSRLRPGGRLLLCGGNELGIASAVKRLASMLSQTPRVLANRRRARIALFVRDDGAGPDAPAPAPIAQRLDDGPPYTLTARPGVFSAKGVDAGTALLVAALADQAPPDGPVLDLGCGIGSLGLAALLRWPEARATLADADARAVASAAENARALSVAERCETLWWDADEPAPVRDVALVLLNPPFHAGKGVDLRPAHALFARLDEALADDGVALIVANRTLPYERALSAIGSLETLQETPQYKLLAVRRAARSSSSSRRYAPGRRSSGSA